MTEKETKEWIDKAPIAELLHKWRFSKLGDPFFQGTVGEHFKTVLFNKRDEDNDTWVKASKKIGWHLDEEVTIHLTNGLKVHCPPYPRPCDYVQVVDKYEEELAYWVSDEWQESPEEVMGAFLGLLAHGKWPEHMLERRK